MTASKLSAQRTANRKAPKTPEEIAATWRAHWARAEEIRCYHAAIADAAHAAGRWDYLAEHAAIPLHARDSQAWRDHGHHAPPEVAEVSRDFRPDPRSTIGRSAA
ncbi:hypothetical protein [Variovorax paradoxus]|uniref:hypothetical protein n=1 Tax=Variovorax paradoxus TaxID=34073 RepID=UPI00277F3544|nr:hypothetical protein [Variovorax paradoxus]MDQ0591363.1 hypothetical protein [Variovorax paradoxus]